MIITISAVFYQTLLLGVMISLGYGLTKAGYLKKENNDFICRLLLDLCLPCLVLSASSTDLGEGGLARTLLTAGIFFVVCILFTYLGVAACRLMKLPQEETLIFSRSAGYPNNGFMGTPLAITFFGSAGAIWAAFAMLSGNIYLFLMILQSFRRAKQAQKLPLKENLRTFITPLNIATVLMILLLAGGVKLPAFALQVCNYIGGCTTALAMLAVGHLLTAGPLVETLKRPSVYLCTLLRNVCSPLVLAFVLSLTPLEADMCVCLVLLMACSAASTVSITASRYGFKSTGYAGQILLQSSLFLPLTLPLVVYAASLMLY